jgi:hypothetical protein
MGLLLESASHESARAAMEALDRLGVQAFSVPANTVPALSGEPQRVAVVDVDGRGLHVLEGRRGDVAVVGWPDVLTGVCTASDAEKRMEMERIGVDEDATGVAHLGSSHDNGPGMPIPTEVVRYKWGEPETKLTLAVRDVADAARALQLTERHIRRPRRDGGAVARPGCKMAELVDDITSLASGAFFPDVMYEVARGATRGVPRVMGRAEEMRYLTWALCAAAYRGDELWPG